VTHFAPTVHMLFCLCLAAPSLVFADSPLSAKSNYLEIKRDAAGEPILVVSYPWARHQRPSVEVRLIEEAAEEKNARPLFFVSEYMKGTNRVAMYRCEELSESLPASTEFTKDEVDFTVLGRRNILGKPSVMVLCRSRSPGPRQGTRAVFALLEAWSVNNKMLFLELPREAFAPPGRFEVVFYRDENIVWTETVDWPGYLQ